MMFELVIGLSFVLAVVSLISVLFTEKKAFLLFVLWPFWECFILLILPIRLLKFGL